MERTAPSILQGSVTRRGWAYIAQPFPPSVKHLSPSRDYIWDMDLCWRRSPSSCSKPGLFVVLPTLTNGEFRVRSGLGSIFTPLRCLANVEGTTQMLSIGCRFQGSNTCQVSHVSRSSEPCVSAAALGSRLQPPLSWLGICSAGGGTWLPPDPTAIPLPVQTWEGEEGGRRTFPLGLRRWE